MCEGHLAKITKLIFGQKSLYPPLKVSYCLGGRGTGWYHKADRHLIDAKDHRHFIVTFNPSYLYSRGDDYYFNTYIYIYMGTIKQYVLQLLNKFLLGSLISTDQAMRAPLLAVSISLTRQRNDTWDPPVYSRLTTS